MNDEQRLMKEAQLGIEAEAFMESYLGKYLAEKILSDIDDAHEDLEKARDMHEVIEAQNKVYRAKSVQNWIIEAISNGKYAEHELSGR